MFLIIENADVKRKKGNYESDEAEDSLIIEEEPLQIDESHNSSDSESNHNKNDSKVRKLLLLYLFN